MFLDCGNGDIEEHFTKEVDDSQTYPLRMKCLRWAATLWRFILRTVYVLDSLVVEVWPTELGSDSPVNISIVAGSDVTTFLDCGNGDIEERFMQEADDFQTDPLPMKCTLTEVGSYTVEIHLANRRSYVAATVMAEVDVAIADLNIAWNHTVFGSSTCVTVSATAGTRITVFWILDDTYALENYAETHSDLQQLCHDYASQGYYDTELRVCNSLSCTFKNLLIAVVQPLVDVAATAPAYKNNSDAVDFVRTTTSGTYMTCECTFGDGELQILYEETISTTYTFTHTYPRPDCYSWSVMCTNYLTTETINGVICVQYYIEDLAATAESPKTYGGDWRVDFNMTRGTNVTCIMTITDSGGNVENVPEASIFYEFGAVAGYGLIDDDLYTAGDYDIKVSCSNLVHIAETTISVKCDDAIQGTKLLSDLRYAAVDQTVTFDLSTTNGSRFSYTIDFGDGSATRDAGPGSEPISGLSASETYAYPAHGYYVVTAIVSNLVSNETVTIEVGAEYPIANAFTISDPNNVVYNTDEVDLVLSWDTNIVNEPSAVELLWDFAHDNLILDEALNLVTSEHTHTRVFPYYTFYNVTVHIANNISTQDLHAQVRVGVPIEGLSIVFPDSDEYNVNATPPANSVFDAQYAISRMTLSISKGSNVLFTVYCGDGQSFQVNRTTSLFDQADSQELTCLYPTPGDYNVTVHAINNLTETNITASTPILVNVEHPIPSPTLVLTPIGPQNINGSDPTCYTLTKDSAEYAPTDAECIIQYADGTQDQVNMTMSGDIFEHCHKDIVLPGNYTINIDCANKVNSYSHSVDIMFQRYITGLSIIATNYTVEQSTDATVVIAVEDGSHMILEVYYGDGHYTKLTEHHGDSSSYYMPLLSRGNRFYHNHTYLEGNYTAIVTASNSVSNMTTSLPEEFIIQYKMEDLTMVNLQPVNMSGAVADGKLCVTVQQPPTDAFCTYNELPFDNVNSRTYYAGTLRNETEKKFCFIYSFPYASIGPRRIDCKCGNKINYIFRTMDVQVIECIRNVTLETQKTFSIFNCYYNVSQNITFTLKVQNGSDFQYTFETRDEATYKNFKDQDLQYRGVPFTRDLYYSYSNPGPYRPDVNVTNAVCTTKVVNECGNIIIQHPIPDVQCILESDIIQYPFEEMRLSVTKDDADEWTDPSVMASIGDFNVTNVGTSINFMLPNDDRSLFGDHHLTCAVFNNVSTQIKLVPFTMQEYIGVLMFTPNNTYLTVGKEFTLTMNLTKGTHVKFKLNYNTADDQVEFYNHSKPLNSTQNYSVNHTYVQEGNFTVNITAYNLVNMTSKLAYFPVMATIHPNISLSVESRIISSPPGIVRYSLCYPQYAIVKPQYVFLNWDIGDGSQPEVIYTEDFKLAAGNCFHKEVTLTNFPSGHLKTCVNCTNAVSTATTCATMEVYRVITEPEVFLHDKVVVATDEAFNVTCKAGKGSNVTVFADFGDGNTSAKVFLSGYKEQIEVPFTHKYNHNGTFNIICNFTNVINHTDGSRSLDVETPVPSLENINVTFLPAIANPPGTFAWTIDIIQLRKPAVNFSVSVGGTFGSTVQLTSWPHTVTQHFTEDVTGDHNFTLRFKNRVSLQEKVITVHFEEPLNNVTLECPPNSALNTNHTGVSTAEVANFTCRKQAGSHSTLHIDFGDDETESLAWDDIDEDAMVFNHTFQVDGDYTVNIEVDNMLGAVDVSCTVSAYDPILNVTLTATPDSIIVNESIEFSIQVPDGVKPPSRANLSFYMNDSIPALVRDFPDSGVDLERTFPNVGDYLAVATVWNGYNSLVLTQMVRVSPSCRNLHNFNFTKVIQVNKTAYFNATLSGAVNELCLTYIFTPEAGPSQIVWRGSQRVCSMDANFDVNKYINITEGVSEVIQTAIFVDKTTLNITLILKTLCHETSTEYTANVTTIPCLTLDFVEDVTNEDGSAPSRPHLYKKKDEKFFHDRFFKLSPDCDLPKKTCKVFKNSTNEYIEQSDKKVEHQEINDRYIIDGSTYNYGDYYIQCKAEMPNTPSKNTTRFFYFRIQESQLRVTINNEQLKVAKGFADTTSLTADLLDPDEEDGNPVYKWYCWREGNELTLEQILETASQQTPIPVPQSADDVNDMEGCFNGLSGLLEGSTNTLTLHGNTQEKTKFVIRVVATLGTRMASDDIELEIKEKPQMDVKVEIKSLGSGQTQLRPGEDATICAQCTQCPEGYKYKWKVSFGDVTDTPDSLKTLAKNKYEEKGAGDCITLLAASVTPYQQYSFECAVAEEEDGERLGEGSTKSCSADVPAHGQLVITPAEGVALTTQFSFSIPGWTVRNGEGCEFEPTPSSVGLKYTYYKKLSASGEEEDLTIAGQQAALPPGTENNEVFIAVIVESTLTGAFTKAETTVKVKPPADLSNAIDNIQVEGNGAAIAMVGTLGSMASIPGSSPGSSPGSVPGSGGNEETSISEEVLAAEARQREKMVSVMVNLVVGVMSSDPDPATFLAISQAAASSGMLPLSAMSDMVDKLGQVDNPVIKVSIATNIVAGLGAGTSEPEVKEEVVENPDDIPLDDAALEAAEQKEAEEIQNRRDEANTILSSTASVFLAVGVGIGNDETVVVGTAQLQITFAVAPTNASKQFDTAGGPVTVPVLNISVSVILNIVYSAKNLYSFGKSAKAVNTGVTIFDLKASDGGNVPYPQDLEEPLDIGMKLDEGKDNYLNMDNTTVDPKTLLFSFWFAIDGVGTGALVLEFQFGATYTGVTVCLDIYIKFNITEKSLNQPTTTNFDFHITLPHSQACNRTGGARRRKRDVSPETDWVVVVPEHLIGPPGLAVGISTRIGDDPKPLNMTPSDMKIRNAITRCRSWNNLDEEWTTEACRVGEGTTIYSTKCMCGKLTEDVKTFSGGITLPTVNTIDFANIFANFLDLLNANPTVMATLLVIFCSYIVLLVWARRKDRLDIERWGVTPLVDNMPDNTYFFKMSVYTGLRQRAGTKSKICFILAGDSGDTGVRVLDDGRGKFFDRGALRHFVLSTNMPLGPLNFLRIWHDNSGEGAWASWFLDKIILEDLQAKTRYMFLCGRWMAVDEDDGQVDRSLPVAGEEEIDGFEHLFFSTARRNLTDEHLWLSVLSRPTKSHFSRAQRLTCCLTLLFTTMLASAMFYRGTPEQEENASSDQVIRLGPIILSVQTLIISIYANLLVVPINLIIVTFFRKSKPRHYIDMEEAERAALKEEMKRQRYLKVETAMSINDKEEKDDDEENKEEEDKDEDKDKKKEKKRKKWPKYPLPWWCSVVAWVLAVLSCMVSAFFVFFYSLEWGKIVSEEWLSSLLFSFVQSVIVIQPLKVVAVAMLVSLIFKKYTGEEEDEEDELNKAKLADDEELVTAPDVDLNTLSAPAAPTAAVLAEARAKAAREKQMWATVKEVVMYLIFLLLVAFIAWGPRDGNMFDMTDNIRGYMAGTDKLRGPNNNETIGFLGDSFRFWLWCNTTVVDMLFNTAHYNEDPTTRRDRAFMRDQVSYRVGQVRLRQLRVPPAQCDVTDVMRGIIVECNIAYSITSEEDRNYTAGWFLETANTTEPPPGSVELAFKYHSMLELNGFPLLGQLGTYGGGGYVADLSTSPRRARKALAALMENNWIDYYTRAVIVEYTLYNPNVNLFLHTSYIIEFPATGSTIPTPKISVFQVYSGVGGMGTAVLVAQIIYIFVMLYYMVRAVKTIRKIGSKEYFAEPWNIYEMVVIISSIVCIAMFGMKEAIGRLVTKELSEHSTYGSYLQLATYIELVDYTVGFIVFMANIKFLRLLRFNSHVRQLAQTFRVAGKDLLYFGASFFLVFGAFSMSAGSLFGAHLYDFNNLLHTIQALYGIILGKINLIDMGNVHPFLGPIFFLTFLGMVYFVLVNMFVSILTSAYTMVRLGEMKDEDEAVVSLFVQRVKVGLGLEKTQRDTGSGYVEPADLLDRRLDVINTWINEYYKEEAMAKKAAMGKVPISKTPTTTDSVAKKPSWTPTKFNF